MLPIPPFDFSSLHKLLAKESTRDRYCVEWKKFVEFAKITSESDFGNNSASEDLLQSYLEKKRNVDKLKGASIGVYLSRISTIILYFWRFEVSKVSKFYVQYLYLKSSFCEKATKRKLFNK